MTEAQQEIWKNSTRIAPDIDNKSHVTWHDMINSANQLKKYCAEIGYKPEAIHSVGRGGKPYATLVSAILGIPKTTISSLTNTLIIDDIADSGITLCAYEKRRLKPSDFLDPSKSNTVINNLIATSVYHPRSAVIPDHYAYKKSETADDKGDWIVFPYEEPLKPMQLGPKKLDGNITWQQLEGLLYSAMNKFKNTVHAKVGVYSIPGCELLGAWVSNACEMDLLEQPCKDCIILGDFINPQYTEIYNGCQCISLFEYDKRDKIIMPYAREALEIIQC